MHEFTHLYSLYSMSHSNKLILITLNRQETIVKSNNTVKMIEIVQVLNSVGHKLHVITTPHILQQQLLLLKLPHLNLQHQCQQRSQRTGKTFNSIGVLLIVFVVYQISQNFFIKSYSPIGTTPTKSPTPEP